jgi:hypothetical protein
MNEMMRARKDRFLNWLNDGSGIYLLAGLFGALTVVTFAWWDCRAESRARESLNKLLNEQNVEMRAQLGLAPDARETSAVLSQVEGELRREISGLEGMNEAQRCEIKELCTEMNRIETLMTIYRRAYSELYDFYVDGGGDLEALEELGFPESSVTDGAETGGESK